MAESAADRDALYQQAAEAYSGAIKRLARGYEPDPDKRRGLVQDIHVALWRSFAHFAGRASMRTWVYRVAHNTAISGITRRRARTPTFVTLDELTKTAVLNSIGQSSNVNATCCGTSGPGTCCRSGLGWPSS
ncbi:MAG TPA: RNA polymerase sigma factor [Vicinamibacterales bacterium]|nr:RNA polymerase sigma factor [Vicinamibacterales bacterium]